MDVAALSGVTVAARIENLDDLCEVEKRQRSFDTVRTVLVDDALVDTGAELLSLPASLVRELGLRQSRTRRARCPAGQVVFNIFYPVRLTVQDGECITEVCEVPDTCPVLVGRVPLEALDFIVDPAGQRLIGNPAHGGEQMIEHFQLETGT